MNKNILYIGGGLLALYLFMRYNKNKTSNKLTSGCGCGANAQANAEQTTRLYLGLLHLKRIIVF